MKNILIDFNILLDYCEDARQERFPESVKVFEELKETDFAFVSSSSIDNFEFLNYDALSEKYPFLNRKQKLKIVHNFIKEFLGFFSAKPLGCFGDGGVVLTNDETLAEKMRMLRVHGQNRRYRHKYIGLGARLDTLQAAVLNVKLKHYADDLRRRQEVAERYGELLSGQGMEDSDRGQWTVTVDSDSGE